MNRNLSRLRKLEDKAPDRKHEAPASRLEHIARVLYLHFKNKRRLPTLALEEHRRNMRDRALDGRLGREPDEVDHEWIRWVNERERRGIFQAAPENK